MSTHQGQPQLAARSNSSSAVSVPKPSRPPEGRLPSPPRVQGWTTTGSNITTKFVVKPSANVWSWWWLMMKCMVYGGLSWLMLRYTVGNIDGWRLKKVPCMEFPLRGNWWSFMFHMREWTLTTCFPRFLPTNLMISVTRHYGSDASGWNKQVQTNLALILHRLTFSLKRERHWKINRDLSTNKKYRSRGQHGKPFVDQKQ